MRIILRFMSFTFLYYFKIQYFQKMTQGGPNFSLNWLSSEDDDEWLISSLEYEFMKDFNANEVCMNGVNGDVLSCYDIKR